ncbi:MAG: FecR domain-containing protein [Cytophagales bacterium]|nr:FecR domain-containing protein [Cytophagales bacterium]
MITKNTKYWELFIKQKKNTITAEELADFNNWKEADAGNLELTRAFETIFSTTSSENGIPEFNPNESWEELRTMIKMEGDPSKTIRLFPWVARVAAAVFLVLGFTFIYYQYTGFPDDALNIQTIVRADESDKKMVELPDGSTVWLNRNSELLYPESFEADTRTLYLKGEAFFEVQWDKNKPFIVYSGNSKTTVLGTSFNLRAYGKEDEITLTVVTGKVAFALADDKERAIITPGNTAVFSSKTQSISHSRNEDINFLSWKTGELIFNDSPLSELIISLERHYNVGVEVRNNTTLNCRFTGNFQDTEIENAIKIITRATRTSYKFTNGNYEILGSGCY